MKSPRTAAALSVAAVLRQHASLDDALPVNLAGLSDRDRAMAREMAFGTCRRFFELEGMLRQMLGKPLKPKDADIHALLLVGIYQLRHMRIPDHAAVSESVSATHQLDKRWASGLVNALLRGFRAREQQLLGALDEAARQAHPLWLLERIGRQWPEYVAQIVAANNTPPEMTLRVNRTRTSREAWLAGSAAAGVHARAGLLSGDAVILERATDVALIPGFAEGDVSVQDQAAQLAAPLLRCTRGQRVLDACAAPGGKTGHLLELQEELDLTALDVQENRLVRIKENLQRLGLSAAVLHGDAAHPHGWWDGKPFDRILLDAPCSATGVIRRHPDIKLLRTPEQVRTATAQQLALLAGVWQCLGADGLLLYSTCSILAEENEEIIGCFLAQTPQACHEPIDAGWGIARQFGRQLLPLAGANDGFYFAVVRKARTTR